MEQYNDYLSALIKGDRETCLNILEQHLQNGVSCLDIYQNIIQRSLYDIGLKWEKNEISVAVEHMATAITETLLSSIFPHILKNKKTGKSAVICCCVNEMHQIGARIAADYMEIQGWDIHYLGANTPFNDLIDFVKDSNPDLIGLSVALHHNLPEIYNCIENLNKHFPDKQIVVGGQAFQHDGSDVINSYSNTLLLSSVADVDTYLKDLA